MGFSNRSKVRNRKRLERTRAERASLLSCVGEPLKRISVMRRVSATGALIGGSMAKDIFRDRERGEEQAYFRQQDAKLIAKLRQKAQFSEIAHALAEKLHADEPALLERIQKLGVTLDTGSAFILAPLVEVAWVDGDVSHAERDTILHIAKQRGVEPGSADYRQLLDWLAHRPSDEVFRTALEAIRIGLSVLPP